MLRKKRGVHPNNAPSRASISPAFPPSHVKHGLQESIRILANPATEHRVHVGQVVPGARADASQEARRPPPTLLRERPSARRFTQRHVKHGLRGGRICFGTFSGIGGLAGVALRRCVNSQARLVRHKPVDGITPTIATRAPWDRSTNRCCAPSTSRSTRT